MQDKNFDNLSNDAQNSRALDENLKNLTAAEKLSSAKKDKTPREKTGKKWKKFAGICVVFLAILVLISAGVFAILLASGKMYAGFKNSEENIAKISHVCGEDVIKKYNDYYNNWVLGKGKSSDLKSLVDEIQQKPNYSQDATCETVVFWYEIRYGNYENAKKALENLQNLAKSSAFVSPDLKGDNSINTLNNSSKFAFCNNIFKKGLALSQEIYV